MLGADCGLLPRSSFLPPLRLPPAFSGRAACGCQSRGRAIRLRAGSGPAPSVFLIKEAAAETSGAEPRAAAPSSNGAEAEAEAAPLPSPAAARSKLRQSAPRRPFPTRHFPPALRTSAPGLRCVTPRERSAPGHLQGALPLAAPRLPEGNSTEPREFLVPLNSVTPMPHTQHPTQYHAQWRDERSWLAYGVWGREPVASLAMCSHRQQCVAATHTVSPG